MKSLVSAFHVRLPFTVPFVLRYCLITLLLTGFVLGAWSGITPVAHAASRADSSPQHAHQTAGVQQQPAVAAKPGVPRRPTFRPESGSSVNQLGLLPFYTYITERLTNHVSLSINVATGNLVLDSHDLSITGTGLPLSLDTVYNSLAPNSSSPWLLSPWGLVSLLVNGDGSVTYTGPSGFGATFSKNSDGSYNDAPGIDATLVKGSSFTLTFHASGEVYSFAASGGGLLSDTGPQRQPPQLQP